jgi:2-oxo-3-hexenedioate decarboxylase
MLHQKSLWDTFPDPIQKLAVFAEHARANNYQIPLLSKAAAGGLDQGKAYHVAAAVRQLREMNGEVVAGRKIGFTNKNIWPEYKIDASNWSYIYENTVVDIPAAVEMGDGKAVLSNISHMSALEPKIEPEIVLGLKSAVQPTMSDVELLGCIDWIAHGLEIVASIFPGWKFTAADTTAAFALHGLLLVGPRLSLSKRSQSAGALLEDLKTFTVELHQNGRKVDDGTGCNVLGSPINALRHMAELLSVDEHNKPLEAGEIITTGTLTKALSIRNGDLWATKINGIELPGLNVKFRMQ